MEKQQAEYFENYEAKSSDLEALQQGIDTLVESDLVEKNILENIRFVTYDSNHLYVYTMGHHITNERFTVKEIPTLSKTGFKIFKIKHSGFIGKERKDYQGASAWLLCDEIETTAVGAKKFPNENILYQPELTQPEEILDVVRMAPLEPYDLIQKGKYNYLTDVVFHEAGHIEHRRLQNWRLGQTTVGTFPSIEQKETFMSIIENAEVFPRWAKELIILNTGKQAISEMYAMLIDREGCNRYDQDRFGNENSDFQKILAAINEKPINQTFTVPFEKSLESGHTTGRLLVRVLEECFPDFGDRKKFVRSVLGQLTFG